MAVHCPNCGSVETQAQLANTQCVTCGKSFDGEGNIVEPGIDESRRAFIEAQLAPREHNVVGNLADVQRLGAEKAPDPAEPAFVMPAGAEADKMPTPDVATGEPEAKAAPKHGTKASSSSS